MRLRTLPAVLLLASLAPCQQDSVPPGAAKAVEAEQGQYARQSISHLGTLWVRGKARSLSGGLVAEIRDEVRNGLRLPRFDDNPLPPDAVSAFDQAAGNVPLDDSLLTPLIDRHLVPRIQEELRRQAVERASRLRSEFQRNSMVSDKTKTVDITGAQMLAVLDAAWLYIPVLEEVTVVAGRESTSATVAMSLRWYHLRTDTHGDVRAEPVGTLHATGFMASRRNVLVNAREFCIRSAARTCVRQLLKETREIPAFSLSGQVTETGWFGCGLDLGSDAGVRLNDRYRLVEDVQGKDGSVRTEEVGWVRIAGRADTASRRPVPAVTVSGSPYRGMALKEIPLSSWSIAAGYRQRDLELAGTDDQAGSVAKGSLRGVRIDAWYTPGLWYGLALGLGGEFASGTLSGSLGGQEVRADQGASALRLEVRQSLPLVRRLGAYAAGSVDFQSLTTTLSSPAAAEATTADGIGFSGEVGLELALLPSLDLRGGIGLASLDQDLGGTAAAEALGSRALSLGHRGMTLSAQLEWTPPALGFDPVDILLGLL